ncbi:LuxR C-terminal-related transcriptional regulator [Hydrocarboniphaga sp.]|uniref:LuxR C-terminal-related transcriptional regulator n=1 Tax=Hydrocarboniphaga sp. TaxID=2033016 RepID=UPI003D143D89
MSEAADTAVDAVKKRNAAHGLPAVIVRDDLFERCFSEPSLRLIVLQASAGHGKTTTLMQFKEQAERAGVRTAWLTFDSADNDTRRFSLHLQAAVDQVAAAHVVELDESGDDVLIPRRRSDWLIDRLLQSRQAIALFFDEFQCLSNPELLAFCQELFERLPEHVRIYIGSRAEPAMSLSRMIVSGRALILRTEDLRFSRAEVSRFFDALMGVDLSGEEIDAIYRLTEGWPVAIQLYGLSLASADVRRSLALPLPQSQELTRYLSSRVLALQPPGVREFLLKTAILKRLSGPVCQAVTGRPDSSQILVGLERSGLFLRRLGSDGNWFKYHGLFSDFLIAELRQIAPEDEFAAHRSAAQWSLKNGYYEDAVHHFVECADFAAAADALAVWGKDLAASGALITLEFWAAKIPFDEIAARPDLAIALAYAFVFLRRTSKLAPLLELFEKIDAGEVDNTTSPAIVLSMMAVASDQTAKAFELIDSVPVDSLSPHGFSAFELGAASNLLAYREITLGRFSEVDRHITMARHCNEVGKAAFSHGYTVGVAGVGAMLQGRLDDAIRLFQRGLTTHYAELGESFSLAALASAYVWGLYEAGDCDSAVSLFTQHRAIISESALPDFCAVAYLSAARAFSTRGERASADELLAAADDICRRNRWPRLSALFGWERVRIALAAGDVVGANAIADSLGTTHLSEHGLPFADEMESETLGRLRLEVHAGPIEAARARLEAEKERSLSRPFRSMKLQLLDIVLLDRKGDRRGAQRLLQALLRAAEIGGFVSFFAEEGRAIALLLEDMYGGSLQQHQHSSDLPLDPAFVAAVLKSCKVGVAAACSGAVQALIEPLSEREVDVLGLLGSGVKNKGMAKHLFVSENTIKFHLKNIFVKLGANSRSEAIITARRLGIIE